MKFVRCDRAEFFDKIFTQIHKIARNVINKCEQKNERSTKILKSLKYTIELLAYIHNKT